MADDNVPVQGGGAPAGAGGSFFQRRLAGVPVWVWIVGGAAVLGGVYYLYRQRQAAAAAAAAQNTSSSSSGQDTSPYTTIVPVDQGLANEQYQALLDALKNLQGQPSQPTQPTQPTGPTSPPPTPTGLHVLSGSVTTVSVSVGWNPVQGATGYRVGTRNNTNSTNPWTFTEVVAPQSSVTVGNLKGHTNYEFTVQAENQAGRSGYPSAVFATTK